MIGSQVEPTDYFIISREFNMNEDEEISLYTFYDLEKKNSFILSIHKDKVYVYLKPNLFGSVFYGDYVYETPSFFIVKEIDPLLLLVNIFHISSKTSKGYECLSLSAYAANYNSLLIEMGVDLDKNTIEETNEVVSWLIENRPSEYFETICDKSYVDPHGVVYFKLNVVKVMNFLNSKLKDRSESDTRACVSILTKFLPTEIAKEFLVFKNISFEEKDEPKVNNQNSFKRKKSYDQEETVLRTDKKIKAKPAQIKKVEVSKDQRCITDLFKKK